MQMRLPVSRHLSGRPRNRLVSRVPARWGQFCPADHLLCLIVPEPGFAGLKACSDGMTRDVKMLRRMLTGRTVTTADVPTLSATPQVQPPSIRGQTFDATIAARSHRGIDTRMMRFHAPSPAASLCLHCLDIKAYFSHIYLVDVN